MRKQKNGDRSFLACLVLDVITLNPIGRRITAFAESPVGMHIRRRVALQAIRTKLRLRDAGEHLIRKAIHKITF